MSRRRSSRTTVVAALGLGMLATACVSADEPGVDVQALQADVVFGFEAPAEDAPALPVTQAPVSAPGQPPQLAAAPLTVPFRNKLPERFRDVLRIPTPVVAESDCPTARIGSSAATQAPEEVTELPVEGLYRWKRSVAVTVAGGAGEITTSDTGFESRIVRGIEDLGAGTQVDPMDPAAPQGRRFTYETVAPEIGGLTKVSSWLVNSQPISSGANVNQDPEGVTRSAEGVAESSGVPIDIPDEAQESLPGGQRVQTGEPNRGLVLTGERYVDSNGTEQGSFTPAPPLLYLPLPVRAGDFWTSTSVDATSGETRRIDGQVNERQSVDACGTLLDGWLVEISEIRASAAGTVQIDYEAVVSTERGAVIIGEAFTAADEVTTVEADFDIGQVEPDVLPEDLR